MNTKLYQLSTDVTFTLTALNAKASLFSSYLKEQMVVVNDFYATYDQLEETLKKVTIDCRETKKSLASVTADAVKLLKEISLRVQLNHPGAYKNYFPENYSIVITKERSLLRAYKIIRSELSHETIPELTALKDQVETTCETLKTEINRVTDAQTDHKLLKEEFNQLYNNWDLEYRRLKMIVKAVLLGKETSYKIFFNTRKTRKVKGEKKYDPILPAPVTSSGSK